MINNYSDYKRYRLKEKYIYNSIIKKIFFPEPNDIYLMNLRRAELHYNSSGLIHKLLFLFNYWRLYKISLKTGISIPKNSCESGLTLPHYGSIVISAQAKIGENCKIQNNVNIGSTSGSTSAPTLGKNVYIGPGAVIYGDIYIADNCYIGANAVVNKTFAEPFSVIGGVPAKLLKLNTVAWNEKKDVD